MSLHCGDTARAIERALASADAAEEVGAPIEAALSRTLAGRALAEPASATAPSRNFSARQRPRCLRRAALPRERGARAGKLGHRPIGARDPATTDGAGIESLTERELQVARLVVDRKTNPEIAAELFLSQKTVETHLRNIFSKMGVATRVALARAVEHSQRRRSRSTVGPLDLLAGLVPVGDA